MAWSTSRLAELAGTTLNTVRHYHRRGLLDEPPRAGNGYKQYGVDHLVRLLQIRRLRDLGVPLAEVRRTETGVGASPEILEALDAELVATIERAERARADIADLREHGAITEVPPGFAAVAGRLSPAERSLVLVYARIYDAEAMGDVRRMLEAEPEEDPATAAFESLPEDADDDARDRLAELLSVGIERAFEQHPWVADPAAQVELLQRPAPATLATMVEVLQSVYRPAQLDVLSRASRLAMERTGRLPPEAPAPVSKEPGRGR